MMDYSKVQIEILKMANKRKMGMAYQKSYVRWRYGETEDEIWVCEGHRIEVIPKSMWFLNKETVFTDEPMGKLKDYIPSDTKSTTRLRTTKEILTCGKKYQCEVFTVEGEEDEVLVDVKQLKDFDLDYCTFKGTNRLNGIVVYEGELLVGYVLPVKYW